MTAHELTLANQEEAEAAHEESTGSSGQHEYLSACSKHPLAVSELNRPKLRGVDHVHLSQIDGTDLVVWMGRRADGFHYPIGRYMRLVRAAPDLDPRG